MYSLIKPRYYSKLIYSEYSKTILYQLMALLHCEVVMVGYECPVALFLQRLAERLNGFSPSHNVVHKPLSPLSILLLEDYTW